MEQVIPFMEDPFYRRQHSDGDLVQIIRDPETSSKIPIPVIVTLEWFKGGWNRVVEVHVGHSYTYDQQRPLIKYGLFGIVEIPLPDDELKLLENQKSKSNVYHEPLSNEFIQALPNIVRDIQESTEATRRAVAVMTGQVVDLLDSKNTLESFFSDNSKSREVAAYLLKRELKRLGEHKARKLSIQLMNPPSLTTFNRWCERGEREFKRMKAEQRKQLKGTKK